MRGLNGPSPPACPSAWRAASLAIASPPWARSKRSEISGCKRPSARQVISSAMLAALTRRLAGGEGAPEDAGRSGRPSVAAGSAGSRGCRQGSRPRGSGLPSQSPAAPARRSPRPTGSTITSAPAALQARLEGVGQGFGGGAVQQSGWIEHRLIGPMALRHIELVLPRCCGNHPGSESLGDLDGGKADPAGRAQDKHGSRRASTARAASGRDEPCRRSSGTRRPRRAASSAAAEHIALRPRPPAAPCRQSR